MNIQLGVKSDPIEYRYTFPWLFRLMAEEGIQSLQLGSFFELYQLPDSYFIKLRRDAENHGIRIESLFTAHRELGGFFREDPEWAKVARRHYERFIEVGSILGAKSVGSNPGAVPRDCMGLKAKGIRCYMDHMKELMAFARERGIEWLTMEPMSCLAEPPTLPDEIVGMAEELAALHRENPDTTANVGYCTDIAHGYINQQGRLDHDPVELFKASLPYLYEIHLKNTDDRFHSTFGFEEENRRRGVIEVGRFRQLIDQNASVIPVDSLGCYLEIDGPKLGRDYTDRQLETQLRESLRYLKEAFLEWESPERVPAPDSPDYVSVSEPDQGTDEVEIAPSMMCVDPLNFESALRQVEVLGADLLHMDIMDGHFVPNSPLGLGVLEALGPRTHLPIDVHLMVEDNDFYVSLLKGWQVRQISVHAEACRHLDRTLSLIRETGARAGVALNPATSLEALDYILDRIDYVLLMTVNPGFAGQKLTPASFRKIAECRQRLDALGMEHIPIQVDGNVSFENIPRMVAAGARSLVAGTSSIFNAENSWSDNMARLRNAIRQGLETGVAPEPASAS